MNIIFPVEYSGSVRHLGKRSFKHQFLIGKASVDVPEICADDAPVVVIARPEGRQINCAHPVEIRNWGGTFLIPYALRDSMTGAEAPFTMEEFAKRAWRPQPNSGALAIDDESISEVGDETRRNESKERDAAISRFSQFVAIDGIMHRIVAEPIFLLDTGYHSTLKVVVDGPDHIHTSQVWRLDRFDSMIEELSRTGTIWVDELDRLEKIRPEVLRPDLLAFDDEKFAILHAAGDFLKAYDLGGDQFSLLSKGSPDLLYCFGQVRDSIARSRDDVHFDQDVFAGAVLNLIEITEQEGVSNHAISSTREALIRLEKADVAANEDVASLSSLT